MLELGAVWNRYAGPLFRTAAVGKVEDDLRKMYEACVSALEATLEATKPGARSQDVQKAAQDVINFYGYEENFRKRVGYCFGVGFPPDWGQGYIMDLKHHEERELKTGIVFHIAPAVREMGKELGLNGPFEVDSATGKPYQDTLAAAQVSQTAD